MIKALLITMVLIGGFCFAMVVATATPTDQEQYEAYMRWKEQKHGKVD